MKITILTDNFAGSNFGAEHGLSYLIEIDNDKILFDTGHTDLFLKNAEKLGISIQNEIEKIVLSHGHWDHGNGLIYLKNKTLFTHPSAFIKRYRKKDNSSVGLNQTRTEIESKLNLITSTKPLQITTNLYYLSEIPRLNRFESKTSDFIDEHGNDDFIPDDSALAAIVNNQLIIITGCSHAGICNICEYAKKITGMKKLRAVIGGFHLKTINQQTLKTIDYFKENEVTELLPSHCTELPALSAFYHEFKIKTVKTGQVHTF